MFIVHGLLLHMHTHHADDSSQTISQHSTGFIMIETNYRVLAYTGNTESMQVINSEN